MTNKKQLTPKILIYLLIMIVCIAIVCTISVICINSYVKHIASSRIVNADSIPADIKYDCILVLGCGVYDDGEPSPMLADRLQRAIELYQKGAAKKILMSGDHGQKSYDEVNVMREYAIEHGVFAEDIFMDHAGFSTYESMYRAKEIFCANNIIIVTQKYHLYRALYIADRLQLNATGVDADYRQYYGQVYRDLREVAARCKDFATCIFKPKPTFLGDTIPVSGNGIVTCD